MLENIARISEIAQHPRNQGLTIRQVSTQPSPQKNFRIGPALVARFNEWCEARGLSELRTFFAGWLALETMTPQERDAIYRRHKAAARRGTLPRASVAALPNR